jgi:fructose/tagatose bisphosphate aldolase
MRSVQVYKPGNVRLHPELLEKHQAYVKQQIKSQDDRPVFLVFHGGSGSTKQEITTAVKNGAVKASLYSSGVPDRRSNLENILLQMNIDTDTQWSYMVGFRDYFGKKKDYLATQVGNPDGADKPNKKVLCSPLTLVFMVADGEDSSMTLVSGYARERSRCASASRRRCRTYCMFCLLLCR